MTRERERERERERNETGEGKGGKEREERGAGGWTSKVGIDSIEPSPRRLLPPSTIQPQGDKHRVPFPSTDGLNSLLLEHRGPV
jgi:hypothetical protein